MRIFFTFLLIIIFSCNSVLSQSVGDFRSRADGNWNNSDTWEEWVATAWINSTNVPTASSGIITINHVVTVTADATIDQTTVENGTLDVTSNYRLTVADGSADDLIISAGGTLSLSSSGLGSSPKLDMNGTFVHTGTFTAANTSEINFLAGSVYKYNKNGGSLLDVTWNLSSSLEIVGVTNTAPSFKQDYSNVTWNCSGQTVDMLVAFPTPINFSGDFTVSSTGRSLIAVDGLDININGNLLINGSSNVCLAYNSTINLLVAGNMTYSSSVVSQMVYDPAGGLNLDINGNLSITSGGINVNSISTIKLAGNLANDGSLIMNSNPITFDGTAVQSLSGSSIIDFYNITAQNDVQVESTHNLKGALTLGDGVTFDADGSTASGIFTLISNATSTAYIAEIPSTSSVTGNIRYQRYTSANPDVYRQIAVPLNGLTGADLGNNFPLTTKYNKPAVYSYNETVTGGSANGFEAVTSGTSLTPGKGYTAYIDNGSPTIIELAGNVNQGSQSFNISYSPSNPESSANDGWNLFANPYPSPIDFDDTGWTKTNIVNTVYVWDATNKGYLSYNAGNGLGNLTGGVIASGQAFWVQASAGPVLTASEAVKVGGTSATFYREKSLSENLVVTLSNGIYQDNTYIVFHDDATNGFDNEFDGRKMWNSFFNLATVSADKEYLTFNTSSRSNCNKQYKLAIYNTAVGEYKLQFGLNNLQEHFQSIKLTDNYLGKSITLLEDLSYVFNISDNAESYGEERFVITFNVNVPEIFRVDNELHLNVSGDIVKVLWYRNDVFLKSTTESKIALDDDGTYYATIEFKDGCRVASTTKEIVITGLNEQSNGDAKWTIYPNPAGHFLNISTSDYFGKINTVIIRDLRGVEVFRRTDLSYTTTEFDIRHLKKGFYILQLQTNSSVVSKYFNKL